MDRDLLIRMHVRIITQIFLLEQSLYSHAPGMEWEYKEDLLGILRRVKSLQERLEDDIERASAS